MKTILVVVVVLVLVLVVGYWRGWFSLLTHGEVDVQVDGAQFTRDREALGKEIGDKARELKDRSVRLWQGAERLTGDEKSQAQKDLGELEAQQARIEQQLKELAKADPARFETIRQDLSNTLAEVEKKIEVLDRRLQTAANK